MASKIKVLKINKTVTQQFDEAFDPALKNEFWFEDNSDESFSVDLDKIIDYKEPHTSKIDLVQNANSHFFKPEDSNNLEFKKSDVENKKFETINLVDKMIKPEESRIRKEIIDMRRMSYENEQRDKEFLLNKLNVDLKPNNNFKNYNLVKEVSDEINDQSKIIAEVKSQLFESQLKNLENQMSSIEEKLAKIVEKNIVTEKTTPLKELDFEKLDSKMNKKFDSFVDTPNSDSFAKEKDLRATENLEELNLTDSETKKNSEVFAEKEKTEELVKTEMKNNNIKAKRPSLSDEDETIKEDLFDKKVRSFFEQNEYTHDDLKVAQKIEEGLEDEEFEKTLVESKNFIDSKPTAEKTASFFEKMDTQELKDYLEEKSNSFSIPVMNNTDYTVANTVDDLEKAINGLDDKKNKRNELFFTEEGGTTEFVQGLKTSLSKNKKVESNQVNFDSFENWYSDSKEVKKLAKLAKKENKKMNKNKNK